MYTLKANYSSMITFSSAEWESLLYLEFAGGFFRRSCPLFGVLSGKRLLCLSLLIADKCVLWFGEKPPLFWWWFLFCLVKWGNILSEVSWFLSVEQGLPDLPYETSIIIFKKIESWGWRCHCKVNWLSIKHWYNWFKVCAAWRRVL